MSNREQDMAGHAVWDSLERLNTTAATALDGDCSADAIERLERIGTVSEAALRRLRACDDALLVVVILAAIETQAGKIQRAVDSFAADANIGHLDGIQSCVDAIVVQMAKVPAPFTLNDVDALHDSATRVRRAAGQYLRRLENEYEELVAKIATGEARATELQASIEREKARVDAFLAASQTQFTSGENERSSAFQTATAARAARFDARLEKQAADFEAWLEKEEVRLEERNTTVDERLAVAESSVDEVVSQAKSAAELALQAWSDSTKEKEDSNAAYRKELLAANEEMLAELKLGAEQHVKALAQLQEQAEMQVGIIASVGMSGGYQKVADQERKAYWIWTAVGATSLVGFIGFAVLGFFFGEPIFDVGHVGARVFASLAFATLAGFAGRYASQHKEAERRNRRFELEMASIGPYLESLPDEMQSAIKRELALRMFGQTSQTGEPERSAASNENGLDPSKIAKEITDAVVEKLQS